jgi:transposase-like protein
MVGKIVNCPHCGKIISEDVWNGSLRLEKVKCIACGSLRTCKDGKRHTASGKIQRYYCKDCGLRFSNP